MTVEHRFWKGYSGIEEAPGDGGGGATRETTR